MQAESKTSESQPGDEGEAVRHHDRLGPEQWGGLIIY